VGGSGLYWVVVGDLPNSDISVNKNERRKDNRTDLLQFLLPAWN
jgi:hypothetical protein